MMKKTFPRFALLLVANALILSVLCFYGRGNAAPPAAPFANSVAQREAMIRELREIKQLLKQQNEMLQKQAAGNR